MPIPKTLDRDFFKRWSPQMAYVLGLFAADGNMIKNNRGAHFIAFYSNDRKLLIDIRNAFGSNHKIGVRPRKGKRQISYQLQIGSKEWFRDLCSLGFSPNKSKTLRKPRIPPNFAGDFVRGYFDGDGCIYFKRLKFADRKNLRQIMMSLFTCGSRVFLEELHLLLKQHGVTGGCIRRKKRGFDLSLSLRDSLALFHLMYDTMPHSGLRLFRKYRLFRKAVRTLYGGVAQLA